jgi:hypothetical protein
VTWRENNEWCEEEGDAHVVGGQERAEQRNVGGGREAIHRRIVRGHVYDRVAVRLNLILSEEC